MDDLQAKYEDAQRLIERLLEHPVIGDSLYCRLASFRSTLPWGYELWARKHVGTPGEKLAKERAARDAITR